MGSPEEAPAAAPEQPESEGAEKAEPSKAEPGSLGADDDGGGYEDGDEEGKEGAAPEPEPSPEEQGEKLLAAAKAGDAEETARLVLEGIAPLQHVDRGGWTPLLWAACNGHAGCVATLVEAGAASTAPSTELGGATAVSDPEGDADKASPNTSAEASSSPVRSRAAAAKMIVNSPLHWAAFKGHTSIVFKLLLHGMPHADIDAEGNTALHLSAAGGEPASAICLLNHGSDLFAKNFFVNTPMDLGTKSAIRKTLATLAVEKTYEMGTTIDRKKPGKQVLKNGPMQWEGMRVQKVAYPTTRILCTGVWCRETNGEGGGLPGNGLGRFFATDSCVKQMVLDRVPTGDALPPANLCSICMEQINQSELALRAGMENKAKEPMAAQIATLERAIEAARKLGSSAAVIAEAETALSRVRAEKALTDYSVEVEATRPIGDTAYLRRLQELLHDAERQLAGRELTQAATALLHSAEAEEALTRCVAVFEGMELCVEMASRADINRLKAAMATSQRDAGHEAQLAAAKKLLKRLLVEARIGQLRASLLPLSACLFAYLSQLQASSPSCRRSDNAGERHRD
jgi:hypothetical protein